LQAHIGVVPSAVVSPSIAQQKFAPGFLISPKAMRFDLGPRGITLNNVRPGPTDTDMNPADSEAAPSNLQHKALERYGHIDEIASFVVYLASPEASLITSASLLADGGYSA
jgi:3-oxoacyl-[acyl-carrier protein] reductase